MRIFFDSSAMLKRYMPETGTPAVLHWLSQADEVVLSVLTMPEVLSALNRLQREGVLSQDEYASARFRAFTDAVTSTIVDMTHDVLERTVVCLERSPLRASDAIHVASAVEAGIDLFVSADRRQCDAAEAMGVRVERIAL